MNATQKVIESAIKMSSRSNIEDWSIEVSATKNFKLSEQDLVYMISNFNHFELLYFSPTKEAQETFYINQDFFKVKQVHSIDSYQHTGIQLKYKDSNSRKHSIPIGIEHIHFETICGGPALFLDRDGIINKDVGYASKIEEIEIIPSIIPLLKLANKKNIKVIIITNQSGIARNFYDQTDLEVVMEYIQKKLRESGCYFDQYYYCPYHIDGIAKEYAHRSILRKPNPGMLLMSLIENNIAISKSCMIGDKESDRLIFPGLRSYIIEKEDDLKRISSEIFS